MASKGVEKGFESDIEKLEGMIAEMERSGLYEMAEELRQGLDSLKHDIDVLPRENYIGRNGEAPLSLEDPLNNIINKCINLVFKYSYKLSVERLTETEILKRDSEAIEAGVGVNAQDVSWKELDRVYEDFVSGERSHLEIEDAKKVIASLEYKLFVDEAINNEKVSLFRSHDRKALAEVVSRKVMELARKEREKGSKKESELNLLARSLDEESLDDEKLWELLTGVKGLKVRRDENDMSRRVKKEETKAIIPVKEKEVIDPRVEVTQMTKAKMKLLGHDTVIKLENGKQKTISFDKLMELFDKHYFGEKDYLLSQIVGMYTDAEVINTHDKSSRVSGKFSALKFLELGEGVRRVEGGMFKECINLEELIVGPNVEYVGERAFSATGLRKLTFMPNTKLTGISDSVFEYNKLRGLDLTPLSNLEGVGLGAFRGSSFLKAVALPNSTRGIGMEAFKNAPIEDISFPPGLEIIESQAFMGSHLKEVILSEDLRKVGSNAFASNRYLEKLEFPDGTVFLSKERNYVGDVPLGESHQEPIKIIPDNTPYREYYEIFGGGEYGPQNFTVYPTEKFAEVNQEYLSRGTFPMVVVVNDAVKDDIRRKRKEALSTGYTVPEKESKVVAKEER